MLSTVRWADPRPEGTSAGRRSDRQLESVSSCGDRAGRPVVKPQGWATHAESASVHGLDNQTFRPRIGVGRKKDQWRAIETVVPLGSGAPGGGS